MPESTVNPTQTPVKGKVEKAHHVLGVISTSIGIVGALGATFVWLFANLYVGDVAVRTDKPVTAVIVKVYDRKGQEATYHMRNFQLVPGRYHLEVTADGGTAQHADVEIRFHEKSVVPVSVTTDVDGPNGGAGQPESKHHWWQFWRK